VKGAAITEAGFTATVISYAQLQGWAVAHFRPAKTERGWRTAVQGDGKGFPDLVLVRGSRLIFAELKVASRRPTDEQRAWLDALNETSAEVYLWLGERDWPEIERVLDRGFRLA
jgi:hypothetical protein